MPGCRFVSLFLIVALLLGDAARAALPADASEVASQPWTEAFGRCLHARDSKRLLLEWKKYRALIEYKLKINARKLDQLAVSPEISEFVSSLLHIEATLSALSRIKDSEYFRNLYSDRGFASFATSKEFYRLFASPSDFIDRNQDVYFKRAYANDPVFREAIQTIFIEVASKPVADALEYFRLLDIPVIYPTEIAAGLQIIRFYKSHGLSAELLVSQPLTSLRLIDLPFPRQLPRSNKFKRELLGLYGKLLDEHLFEAEVRAEEIASFLKSWERSQIAKIARRKLTDEEIALILNELSPPVNLNAYDEYVDDESRNPALTEPIRVTLDGIEYTIGPREGAAIDGVVRTLWGEARSCQDNGLYQFQALGLVVANRVVAVENWLAEQRQLDEAAAEVDRRNADIFLSEDPRIPFHRYPQSRLKGGTDFGRLDSRSLPAAQVISKFLQFSVWNAFTLTTRRLSFFNPKLPPNIPDVSFLLKGPRPEGDQRALLSVLCPGISRNRDAFTSTETRLARNDELWKQALYLATLIVMDSPRYRQLYRFNPRRENIVFYTHGPDLPFATERRVDHLVFDGQRYPLRGKRGGSCNLLRFFTSRGSKYGLD